MAIFSFSFINRIFDSYLKLELLRLACRADSDYSSKDSRANTGV